MKLFNILFVIFLLSSSAFSQLPPSGDDFDNPEPLETAEPTADEKPAPLIPDYPEDAETPQTQKAAVVVQFLCNFGEFDIYSKLVEFGKQIEKKYQGKVELQFVNISQNEKALEKWTKLRKLKSSRFQPDVICTIKDRFIIELRYIEQLLPEFIDYELNPATTFDPMLRNVVPITKVPVKKPVEKTDWKGTYSVLLYLTIILIPLILGFVITYLVLRKKSN